MVLCVPISWGGGGWAIFYGLEDLEYHGLDRDDKDHDYLEANFVQFLYYPSLGILTLPTMGLLEQPQILGGAQCTPPIRYACSTCAILMKLSEIKQLDK